MAEEEEKELPNLEEIAKRLTSVEEDFKISEIEPRITEAYLKIAKYKDDKGRVRYKHDFSNEPAKIKEISDMIFDALVEHIHLLEYNMEPDIYTGLKDIKNANGLRYVDVPVHHAIGISRESLRKSLENIKKDLSLKNILGLITKQVQDRYIPLKINEIEAPLDDSHLEHIKKYIATKADEHKLPAYKDRIKDIYDLEGIKPVFREIAGQIYRKK